MKRFIFSVLAVTVFFVGLGTLAERAGAGSKSDEKALAIIREARQAIGGDAAVSNIKSMVIAGQTTRTIKIDGVEKTVQGETEIAMQLPDKLMKMVKIGHDDGTGEKQVDVVVVGDKGKGERIGAGTGHGEKRIVIKRDDGTVQEYRGAEADKIIAADRANGADVKTMIIKRPEGDKGAINAEIEKGRVNGDHVMIKRIGGPDHEAKRNNEMLRLTLALLLAAPQGIDVSYTFGGEADVDGTTCNIVVAESAGSAYTLFISKSSNLPVMMRYSGMRMPHVMMFKTKAPDVGNKDTETFTRRVEGPPMETVEFTVRFTDYRAVNGVQLPFRWTQAVGPVADEVFEVARYELNPTNIGDRFNNDKVKVRVDEN